MASIKQITVWARGVIQDKEGRDISNGIAAAADVEGKFTQAFDNYDGPRPRAMYHDSYEYFS
ncbi:MAG: hypothetical protein EHM71_16500, partial [Zetaproteobacteria bacterium]